MRSAYDLVVIGSGPAGEQGALEARRLGRSVLVVDERLELGGNCCHTGTLPSKTLRESSLVLSRALEHDFLPAVARDEPHPVDMAAFMYRAGVVVAAEAKRVRTMLERAGADVAHARARFVDAHRVALGDGADAAVVEAANVLIACGSRPVRPASIPFDGLRVVDSDDLLRLPRLPKSLIVLGGGVIGTEYASIFANLGIPVQLVEAKPVHLPFIDAELIAYLHRLMADHGVRLTLGAALKSVAVDGEVARVVLGDGRELTAECVLYALGRASNADRLDLAKAGVACDERAKIAVDKDYHTSVPHIAAAGDVIGFPSLAATSGDQGRAAVRELFGLVGADPERLLPYGIYTIPEISTVGLAESDAATQGRAIVVGRCRLSETARGLISGDDGLLKLVFDRADRRLLGAHCIGARATDIIHAAMFCIRLKGGLEDLVDAVFNYPTVSGALKLAALDALWRLEGAPAPA